MDALRELVLPRLDRVKKSGSGFMARCPVHEDGTASLSVAVGRDHPVVLNCHAGCSGDDILATMSLTWADLSTPRVGNDRTSISTKWTSSKSSAPITYDYRDESGVLLFQVVRMAGKKFRQRRPDPTSADGWTWSLGDTRRVLYRLPEIVRTVREGRLIYICEGEKDVQTIVDAGLQATCNSGGAGSWRSEYAESLREAVVIIVADRDAPGQAHARQVRDSLKGVAASITIVEAVDGKDVTDHIRAGYGLEDLVVTWEDDPPAKPDLAPDLWEFLATDDPPYDWIIPDLLERGDRVILTGFEGLGKSFLVRQMAVAIAAGIHPFLIHRQVKPHRVLVIDCENSERQSRRKFRPLAEVSIRHGCRVPDGNLRIIHRSAGIDLTRDEDANWLRERVTAHKPDVLFIGPFYRLHNANINDEVPARKTVAILDEVRVSVDCAMIIEAHAGHGEAGKGRSVRPAGSSLLMRWPEFGFGITPAKEPEPGQPCTEVLVKHWRGQRDERNWPSALKWGDPGDWPWKPSLAAPNQSPNSA